MKMEHALQHLQIGMAHKPCTVICVERDVVLHDLAEFQTSTLDYATAHRSLKLVCSSEDSEVGDGDLPSVPAHDGRHSKEVGIDLVVSEVEFEVTAVVQILPLQLVVCILQPSRVVVSGGKTDVRAIWAR